MILRFTRLAFFTLVISNVLVAQQLTFQRTTFSLPWKMSALGELTAYVPSQNAIYIFGGAAEPLGWMDTIVKVDLNQQQAFILTARLPFSKDGQLAVTYNSNDGKVYLFHLTDVYRFDPGAETISLLASNILPEIAGDYTIAKYVVSQNDIYLFGNRGSGRGNYTLRYDPANNAIQVLSNTMQPSNNTSPSAAYCESRNAVYLFGGNFSSSSFNLIQRFDPTGGNFFTLPISLPTVAGGATAVSVPEEDAIFVFGGYDNSIALNDVYKLDCGSETLTQVPNFPTPLVSAGVEYISSERRIYILGGTTARTGGYYPATDAVYYLSFNSPPLANAGSDQRAECTSLNGTQIQLNGSSSSDSDGDPLNYTWWENGAIIVGPTNSSNAQVILALGNHIFKLIVTDSEGGTDDDEVLIQIVDTTPPAITLNGDDPLVLECHVDSYVELGAQVSDACDGSPSLVISGSVNNNVPGAYDVMYTATDAHGNIASKTRTVNVVDTTPPTVTLNGDNPMPLECHVDSYIETGAHVSDMCDHSVSLVISGGVNSEVPGTYYINYAATDANGNSASKTREVNVIDNTPPTITLQSSISLWPPNHKYKLINADGCVASVSDVCAGNISISQAKIASVSCDEPEDAPDGVCTINDPLHICFNGDGSTIEDIVIASDCRSVNLRSERAASGNGRVYTINLEVSDASGNVATASYEVSVPKDQGATMVVVDNGPYYTTFGSCGNSLTSKEVISNDAKTAGQIWSKPESYGLAQNYPNPFNPETEIRFQLPEANHVLVKIFNTLGEEILTLLDAEYPAGYYTIRWDGRDNNNNPVASGIYLYQLQAGNLVHVKKMNLLR